MNYSTTPLSFVNVGQTFYGFGWESILLETGFLAIFLGDVRTPASPLVIWLLRWVLFRVMFGAGLIKLRGDPCWRDLTCLFWHYETQPMPNPLSWYFHHFPAWAHKGGVVFNHVAELIAPLAYFVPGIISVLGGIVTIAFQGILMLSGNLSFLNLLTIVLAIGTFNDKFLAAIIPFSLPAPTAESAFLKFAIIGLSAVVAALSVAPIVNMLSPRQAMNASFNSLHLVNTYGAFGSITRPRYEVIILGTDEAVITETTRWREYGFKGKPGDPKKRPSQMAPYHLRLDWLMWFEALNAGAGSRYYSPWFVHFLAKLLQNDAGTLSLMSGNPFSNTAPKFVRADLYTYRFTAPDARRTTGAWWAREYVRSYLPPVSMNDPLFRTALEGVGWLK